MPALPAGSSGDGVLLGANVRIGKKCICNEYFVPKHPVLSGMLGAGLSSAGAAGDLLRGVRYASNAVIALLPQALPVGGDDGKR